MTHTGGSVVKPQHNEKKNPQQSLNPFLKFLDGGILNKWEEFCVGVGVCVGVWVGGGGSGGGGGGDYVGDS